jgi:hypothetical protein
MTLRKALANSDKWHWVNQSETEWVMMKTLCGKNLEFHLTDWMTSQRVMKWMTCSLCFPKDKDYPMCKSCERATPERRLLFAVSG